MIGRSGLASDAYVRAHSRGGPFPSEYARARAHLDAVASVGGSGDSVAAALERLDLAARRLDPATRAQLRSDLEFYHLLAVPALGANAIALEGEPASAWGRRIAALAIGDAGALRAVVLGSDGASSWRTAAPVMAWLNAHLLAAVGDTAAAIGGLDIFLGNMASIPRAAFHHPADAAGVVRAMALRAQLADAVNDPTTAGRWARAVLTIWGRADPDVRGSVSHLHAMMDR